VKHSIPNTTLNRLGWFSLILCILQIQDEANAIMNTTAASNEIYLDMISVQIQ